MNNFFFIFCIIVFLFKTQTVFSNNLIYDVNNVEVNGKINNDLDKKKLIQSAFQKAFTIFINKMLLRNDAISLSKTKINIIEDLVFAYQIVKDEKKNKKENILKINVKFDQKKITNFFAQNKISYTIAENISLTLLPIFINDKDILIYNDNFFYNNWLTAKDKIENTNDMLIKYNLALENIEDLQYINLNKNNLESIDIKKLISLKNEKNYILLIIYSTEDNFGAYFKTFIQNKKIDKSIDLETYPESDTKTYEEAILTLKEEIAQIWKSQNLIDATTPSFLDLFLDVKKINDYSKLRLIFDSIDAIEDYSVLEMTNKKLKIRIKYQGKLSKLRDKLTEKKINIQIVNNRWMITVN